MTVSDLLEQPCNKSDNINKVVTCTSCSQLVPNLLTRDKQCEDNLLTDLLQVRLLRACVLIVRTCFSWRNRSGS